MKKFDKAAAMRGAKVCTRDGWAARILCFDFNKGRGDKTIVAELLVMPADDSIIECYYPSGAYYETTSSGYDLMMADDDYQEKLERGEYGTTATPASTAPDPAPCPAPDPWDEFRRQAAMAMIRAAGESIMDFGSMDKILRGINTLVEGLKSK